MGLQISLHACKGCGRANPEGASCPNCGMQGTMSGLRLSPNAVVPLPPQMRDVSAELRAADKLRAESAPPQTHSGDVELACESCGTAARTGFSFCLGCGEKGAFVHRSAQAAVSSSSVTPLALLSMALSVLWESVQRSPKRISGINAFLSFLFPGLGQILAGQGAKGLCLLFLSSFMVYTWDWPPFGLALLIIRGLLSLDAYRISEKRRKQRRVRDWEWNFKL